MVFKVGEFEGPLDLLLHLIRTNELEIEAISLIAIMDQFIAFVSESTLSEQSDFILMASHLIALKARYLNKGKIEEQAEVGEDPLEILVEKLRLYRKIKEVGEYLKSRECTDYRFFREAEVVEICEEYHMDIQLLHQALQRVTDQLSRFDDARQEFFRLRRKKFVSVREKRLLILKMLGAAKSVTFADLCDSREEAVAVFLALLELLKLSKVRVYQEDVFSEITIVSA